MQYVSVCVVFGLPQHLQPIFALLITTNTMYLYTVSLLAYTPLLHYLKPRIANAANVFTIYPENMLRIYPICAIIRREGGDRL